MNRPKKQKRYAIWDTVRQQVVMADLTYHMAKTLCIGKERCTKIVPQID